MQGGYVTIEISGLQPMRRKLVTWGTAIESLAPAWEQVADDLRDDFRLQFEQQGGLFGKGSRWQKLAPSTVKQRERLGYFGPAPILFREGTLYDSVTNKSGPDHIEQVTADSLIIGTGYWTAGWLHFGTSRMPARRIVGLSWTRRSGIVRRLNEFVQDQARAAGIAISGGDDGD